MNVFEFFESGKIKMLKFMQTIKRDLSEQDSSIGSELVWGSDDLSLNPCLGKLVQIHFCQNLSG